MSESLVDASILAAAQVSMYGKIFALLIPSNLRMLDNASFTALGRMANHSFTY